jgi:fibronectin-binding autotransporter adhesin
VNHATPGRRLARLVAAASLLFPLALTSGAIMVAGDVDPTYNGVDDPWDVGGDLTVGDTTTGTMSVDAGAVVTSTNGFIGRELISRGVVTVTGPGSAWINSNWLIVGRKSRGTLNIQGGGYVSNQTGWLGFLPGGVGKVSVTGSGAMWESSGGLLVGTYGGVGTVDIKAGGTVSAGSAYISYETGSVGVVTVTGAGSEMNLSGLLNVGSGGNGTLNIENGGAVNVPGDTRFGSKNIGSGSIQFAAGTLNTAGLLASPGELLGTGTVNTATLVSDLDLVFDASTGLQQQIVLNNLPGQHITINLDASDPANTGTLGAGYRGAGTLTIADGLSVSSGLGYLGYYSGATGAATVTGAGSSWVSSNKLTVGFSGNGTLDIQAGGSVSNWNVGHVGLDPGSTGVVVVTGPGSTWDVSGALYIATFGNGTLNIQAGGAVSNTQGFIGFEPGSTGVATVTGSGSTWTNSGSLEVGKVYEGYGDDGSGSGTMIVQAGGSVSNTEGSIGPSSRSTGVVTVSGTDSTWNNSGGLYVGRSGSGTLNIQAGGSVNSLAGYIGRYPGATGASTVTGTDSRWINTNSLYIGGGESSAGGTGRLTVADGGQAIVGGTLKIWDAATVQGDGQIIAALLLNGGTVAPGSSTGVLTLTGDYTQESGGTLSIELAGQGGVAGVDFDRLDVSGQVMLDGALEVLLIDGYAPSVGDMFEVLKTPVGIIGSFISVEVPTGMNVVYGLNGVSLVAQWLGDLDGDGFAGITDLNSIISNWNQSVPAGSWADGDTSGDGFVGIEDLNAVLGNWNTGTPPPPEVSALVPEPASLAVLAFTGGLIGHRRRRP